MNIPRILGNSGNVLARSVVPYKKNCGKVLTRTYYQVTPPTVKVSFAERMTLSLLVCGCVMFIPAWIIYHVPDYQGDRAPKK